MRGNAEIRITISFTVRMLFACSNVGIHVLLDAPVTRPESVSGLVGIKCADLVRDMSDLDVILHHRVRVLGLGQRLVDGVGGRQVRLVYLHEVDAHGERLPGPGRAAWPGARLSVEREEPG